MSDVSTLKQFYELLPFPVEVVDESGSVIYTNKSFCKLWGYDTSELSEYNFFEDREIIRNGLIKKISGTPKAEITFHGFTDSLLKEKDRTIPILETRVFPVVFNNNNYLILIHQDKTETVLNEAEIVKAREDKKEAERLKSTFLNVLSHELRTPLNIILGYSSMIKESMKDKITSEDRVYLDNLYSGSTRLFKSITQMLEFAQIEAGNFSLNLQVFDFISLVNSSVSQIKKECDKKELKLTTSLNSKVLNVFADIQCTENVLSNLLGNAVKFTKQGFIHIEVDCIENRNTAVFRIKDTGVGISAGYLDHIFEPFSQEDLELNRNFEGNGLGLALTKRYIEKMGGVLLVDSIKGVGTTFTFTLPLALKSDI